jgi:acyl carrier protein
MTMQSSMDERAHEETEESVAQAVMEAVQKCLGKAAQNVTLQSNFSEIGAHSLDVVTIAFELEDRFDIEIHRRNLDDFASVQHAVDIVISLLAERRAARG